MSKIVHDISPVCIFLCVFVLIFVCEYMNACACVIAYVWLRGKIVPNLCHSIRHFLQNYLRQNE